MKRVLLLLTTTSYRAEAFLAAIAKVGAAVTVGSDREQVLARFHREGNLEISFHDAVRGTGTIMAFARDHPLDAIIAADDDGALLAAHASVALGWTANPVSAVTAARHKGTMRRRLADAGIPSPWFACAATSDDPRDWAARVPYPCVLKPTFLSGSRGVMRADSPGDFEAAFRRIAKLLADPALARRGGPWAGEILVESFVPGAEIALEGLLTDGELRVLALFDKPDPLDGPFFEETIYVTPTRRSGKEARDIVLAVRRAAEALGLREGPVHAELRVHESGVRLIEIAPRSIGGLCSRALRFGDGRVSLEELLVRHALGEDVSGVDREPVSAGVMMIPIPRRGRLDDVRGNEEASRIPLIEEVRIAIPTGDLVVPLPEGSRYLGFIFARGGSPGDVEAALRDAHRALVFTISPGE